MTEDSGGDGGEEETEDAGGDVDPEVEEYFDEVVAIGDRTNTALDDVNERMSAATFDTEAEEVEANQKALEDIVRALETAAIDLGGLDPPQVAAAEHEEFLTAVGDYYNVAGLFYQDLLRATTMEDLEGLGAEFELRVGEAIDKARDTCLNLEGVGSQYIEGLDLACPGDGP